MPRITAAMVARGRSVADPRLSPDGSAVAFVATANRRSQLVTLPVSGGPELAVTADAVRGPHPSGGGAFDWLPDGTALVFVDGDGSIRVVSATGGPAASVLASSGAYSPVASPDGEWIAYVLDDRHVAVAPARGGDSAPWPMRVSSGTNDFALDPAWSPDGRTLAWLEWDVPAMPWDASRIVIAPLDGRHEPRAVAGGDGVSVQQPRFSPDGRHLAYLSDETGWTNLWVANADGGEARPLVEEPFEHGEPSWGPGQRSFAWSPDGGRIAFVRNEGGFGRLCVVDVKTGSVRDVAKAFHVGLTWRGDSLAAVRTGATTPPQVVVYDAERDVSSDRRRTVAFGPVGFGHAELVEPEVVHWRAEDGAELHGRLYRPPGVAGAAPMLVWIHGGPTGQQTVTFNARVAYFVDRGWAVLVPDHRGSTGWGRAYTQAMAGRWGDLDSSDTAAGVRAAIDNGWADPRRVVAIGASAGGFTVFGLLAWHGELFAAGVDLYGVADLLDLDETTHRFEKHYLHSIVGPLPDTVDRYRSRSPVTIAEQISAPVLILQGAADKVVPPAQSEAIAERIRRGGGVVELHMYDDEGHGWSNPDTVEDELARIDDFLRRHVLRWRA